MVCPRCIKVVKDELNKLGIHPKNISLGEVELIQELPLNLLENFKAALIENGFELIEDKSAKLIEDIKKIIILLIHENEKNENLSTVLESKLNKDYTSLSSLFSSKENITIEHYYILQKIEKAKELLKYDELTLSEIAYKLGYASVNHLSSQFKKITGMTATEFKKNTNSIRKSIDSLK